MKHLIAHARSFFALRRNRLLVVFAIAAWRFELGRRPSIADHPHAPEIPPPGQVRVAPLENDDDALYPPRH